MFQLISALLIAALVGIDRVSKILAVNNLKDAQPVKFLFGAFQLRYTENTGAAFSAFSGNTAVLTVFTSLVILLCLFVIFTRRVKSKFLCACLIMVTAGGIGNLIDRFSQGYVVDFFEPLFMNFAVFNVADIFITVGAFLLIGYEIYDLVKEKKSAKTSNND